MLTHCFFIEKVFKLHISVSRVLCLSLTSTTMTTWNTPRGRLTPGVGWWSPRPRMWLIYCLVLTMGMLLRWEGMCCSIACSVFFNVCVFLISSGLHSQLNTSICKSSITLPPTIVFFKNQKKNHRATVLLERVMSLPTLLKKRQYVNMVRYFTSQRLDIRVVQKLLVSLMYTFDNLQVRVAGYGHVSSRLWRPYSAPSGGCWGPLHYCKVPSGEM